MTRIAILSDIHANMFALEAVIEDIQHQDIDEVLVAGDIVGRGPQGSAVTKRIMKLGWKSVRGNHESYTLSFRAEMIAENCLTSPEWAAARWIAAELDDEDANFLQSFPFTLTSSLVPELRVFHGSPRGNRDGIAPWTGREKCEQDLLAIKEHLFVCGHTHRILLRKFSTGIIVNAGSVGLPFNGEHRAQYAILEFEEERLKSVTFRAVPYDKEGFLAYFESSGFAQSGGIIAHLIKMELQTAAPYLTPFLRWAYGMENRIDYKHLDIFLAEYSPLVAAEKNWPFNSEINLADLPIETETSS